MAVFDARVDAGRGGEPSLKAGEARCILKLGTSADYALCGAKTRAWRPPSCSTKQRSMMQTVK